VPTQLVVVGSPEEEMALSFDVMIKNQGLAPANSSKVEVTMKSEEGEEYAVYAGDCPSLAVGAQVTINVGGIAPPAGRYSATALSDSTHMIAELDESNNWISISVIVASRRDEEG